jgi:hypothetical protein
LLADDRVVKIRADQCQLGATVLSGPLRGSPVMKPTGWVSNSPHIPDQHNHRCGGPRGLCSTTGTPHKQATGKVARAAAIYPFLFCEAILVGPCKQLREDGSLTAGACGFTTWNETREGLNDAHVRREANHILNITACDDDGEAGSDE